MYDCMIYELGYLFIFIFLFLHRRFTNCTKHTPFCHPGCDDLFFSFFSFLKETGKGIRYMRNLLAMAACNFSLLDSTATLREGREMGRAVLFRRHRNGVYREYLACILPTYLTPYILRSSYTESSATLSLCRFLVQKREEGVGNRNQK
jgi:hypothetical protein